jgi:hypothetical protein
MDNLARGPNFYRRRRPVVDDCGHEHAPRRPRPVGKLPTRRGKSWRKSYQKQVATWCLVISLLLLLIMTTHSILAYFYRYLAILEVDPSHRFLRSKSIMFPTLISFRKLAMSRTVQIPPRTFQANNTADFGSLTELQFLPVDAVVWQRQIVRKDDEVQYEDHQEAMLEQWDTEGDAKDMLYDALDYDTTATEDLVYQEADSLRKSNHACRRQAASKLHRPICNVLHEKPMRFQDQELYEVSFVNSGFFRHSWRFSFPTTDDWHANLSWSWVLKTLRLYHDTDAYSFEMIQREAIVMDRLSTSPRIVDIYGLCGTSVLVEDMCAEITTAIVPTPAGASITDPARGFLPQEELDQLQVNDVHPLNNLTNDQKLDMAIVMAQGVADMHGYFGGIMNHGDVHPDQWLINSQGQLKRK